MEKSRLQLLKAALGFNPDGTFGLRTEIPQACTCALLWGIFNTEALSP